MSEVTSRGARIAAIAIASAAAVMAVVGVLAYASLPSTSDNPHLGAQFAIGVTGVIVGAYVAYRKGGHPLGWVLLAGAMGSLLTFFGFVTINWLLLHTHQQLLIETILAATIWGWLATRGCFLLLAPLAYPGGWPRSRAGKAVWVAGVASIVVTCVCHARVSTPSYFAGQPTTGTARLAEQLEPWGARATYVLGVFAVVAMVVRVARLGAAERRRHLPFAVGLAVLVLPTMNALYNDAFHHYLLSWADGFEDWTTPVVPVVLAVGILMHHTLDIEVVLRRTTEYVILAALAIGTYVATVELFSLFLQHGSGMGPVVATLLIAVGLIPAHAYVERFVSQRIFGNRGNPYAVVTSLGSRLEQAPVGDQALQLVADTLAEQLRLPFVAVEVAAADDVIEAARHGQPGPPVERFPLAFRGEPLGALVVARRSDREPFRPSERSLLEAFARQAGVVAHNASLSQALLQSRAVLVQTREEERRRIRRDLHDGLGPTLATVSLSLGAAAERLETSDTELAVLLHDLEAEITDAIADIRRLVYDLRPPALDELGLVRALRKQAAQLAVRSEHHDAIVIDVDAPTADVALPSAVELAAYRVALEALTNVVRHSQAERCRVALEHTDEFVLTVEDDGVGIADDAPRGVGLRSMRERVIELGGSLRIETRIPRGTAIQACFPLQGLT